MRIIDKTDSFRLLTMNECIAVMKDSLIALAEGKGKMPLRSAMMLEGSNLLGMMPSHLPNKGVFGTKIITVFPENHKKNVESHQGIVVLFDDETGSIKGIVDAVSITATRTAAVSAVATDLLANKNATTLAIIGAGHQGRTHLDAIKRVRQIDKVYVWDYYHESAIKFSKEMQARHSIEVIPYKTIKDCTINADIVCTVSLAKEPILFKDYIKKGAHVNAVGACRPQDREIASDLVASAKVYVDRMESAMNEAGDILFPISEGLITQEHIVCELGDVGLNKTLGRSNENEITMFEAQGLAIEDLACAQLIYEKACKEDLGTTV